jgi:hypothetical protein
MSLPGIHAAFLSSRLSRPSVAAKRSACGCKRAQSRADTGQIVRPSAAEVNRCCERVLRGQRGFIQKDEGAALASILATQT